jgi:hypothetical protein
LNLPFCFAGTKRTEKQRRVSSCLPTVTWPQAN